METIGLIWHEWFDQDVKNAAMEEFEPMKGFYRRNGLLKIMSYKWIRERIYEKVKDNIHEHDVEKTKELWATKMGYDIKDWQDNEGVKEYMAKNYLDAQELDKYFLRETAADIWSKSHWDKVAPQLFLAKKEYYDIVSIEYITVPKTEKNLIREKYYQLKDEDVEISELVKKNQNKLKGTISPRQIRVSEMNSTLKYHVNRSNIGKYYGPIVIEKNLMVFRILKRDQGELTEEIKQKLVEECMKKFLEYGSTSMSEYLCEGE